MFEIALVSGVVGCLFGGYYLLNNYDNSSQKQSENRQIKIVKNAKSFNQAIQVDGHEWPKLEFKNDLTKLMTKLLTTSKLFLLEGSPQSGKTTFIKEYLIQKRNEGFPVLYFSCSNVGNSPYFLENFYTKLFGFDDHKDYTERDRFDEKTIIKYLTKFKNESVIYRLTVLI